MIRSSTESNVREEMDVRVLLLVILLGISVLPAYAKLSLDSVAGAQTCTAADVIDASRCN